MALPVFVVDAATLASDTITLDGDEGRHAVAVKRLRVGEGLVLTDGRGQAAECEVAELARHALVAEVRVRRFEARAVPQLVVVQAIPKGDHAERAVDLLTEVGADVIVPWAAARNVVSWRGDRAEKALHRWRATAKAAAKQSRRLWHPELTALHSTADVAGLVARAAASFVLHASAPTTLAGVPLPGLDAPAPAPDDAHRDAHRDARREDPRTNGSDVVLVVGPEGGITADELATLAAAGAEPARLGREVMRSSSAGMAAAAVILSRTRWTDLSESAERE